MPVDLGYGLKLWTGGLVRGGVVGHPSAFLLIHFRCDSSRLQSDCTRSLAQPRSHLLIQSQTCTPVGVGADTHYLQVPAMPGPVKPSSRPRGTLIPTYPPTFANHQHDGTLKHALPPSLIISSVHAPSIATRRHPSSLRGLCGRMLLLITMVVAQASHLFLFFQKHYAMVRCCCRKPLSA